MVEFKIGGDLAAREPPRDAVNFLESTVDH